MKTQSQVRLMHGIPRVWGGTCMGYSDYWPNYWPFCAVLLWTQDYCYQWNQSVSCLLTDVLGDELPVCPPFNPFKTLILFIKMTQCGLWGTYLFCCTKDITKMFCLRDLFSLIILWLCICTQQRIFARANVDDLHVRYSLKPAAAAPRRTLNHVQLNIFPPAHQ